MKVREILENYLKKRNLAIDTVNFESPFAIRVIATNGDKVDVVMADMYCNKTSYLYLKVNGKRIPKNEW